MRVFMIDECRRHTTNTQSQEQVGGLAYRIIDAEASGRLYVSPLGFQKGAVKVAGAGNIFEVTLKPREHASRFRNGVLAEIPRRRKYADVSEGRGIGRG